jgi:hypothetical protein
MYGTKTASATLPKETAFTLGRQYYVLNMACISIPGERSLEGHIWSVVTPLSSDSLVSTAAISDMKKTSTNFKFIVLSEVQ